MASSIVGARGGGILSGTEGGNVDNGISTSSGGQALLGGLLTGVIGKRRFNE